MTSPALLYLSRDTHSISEAFTATSAAEAVIFAARGITSRFIYAQGQTHETRVGYATMQLADPDVFGFSPDGKPGHHLVENPEERRAV